MSQVSDKATVTTRSNAASQTSLRRANSPHLGRQIKRLTDGRGRDRERIRKLENSCQALERRLAWANQQLDDQRALAQTQASPISLERDRPLPGHQFGTALIALCIELAKRVGFRATEFVIKKLFQTLRLDWKVPSHDAIEQWTLRLGVAKLSDTFTKDQRVLWMADHSSQIGKEKVLLIIGILVDDLPPPGKTMDLEKLKVLAIVPGQSWKKEDVAREYARLAEKIGAPCYLLCDGAVELRHPAQILEKDGKKTIVLRDLKHHAANLLEKQIGRTERFKEFLTEVGLTRNRVQQTELGHFMPPSLKQKSRFMNLAPLLCWSRMILYHLDHPESGSRDAVKPQRMEEKLGWVRGFAEELESWRDCQEVIDQTLAWINRQGLGPSSSDQLGKLLAGWLDRPEAHHCVASEIAGACWNSS